MEVGNATETSAGHRGWNAGYPEAGCRENGSAPYRRRQLARRARNVLTMAGTRAETAAEREADTFLPVLSLQGVSKTFQGTKALSSVALEILPGEVHAVVGANGSGKSTLIKILSGFHRPDAGAEALFNGAEFELGSREGHASEHMRFVHQDLGLILELSAMDNLALTAGFRTSLGGRINWREQKRDTEAMLARLGVSLDVHKPLSAATPVQRTIVAIAAALIGWESGRGLLVLDEPTAVLPHTEVDHLLKIVREVQRLGASVLYVSHRLDEIFEIADRVTVLRDGRLAGTYPVGELNQQSMAELMVGDRVNAGFRLDRPSAAGADPVLSVHGISGTTLDGFSCEVRKGEILGVAGLAGSGAEEISYLLSGVRPTTAGEVMTAGGQWEPASQLRALAIPLVPADRAGEGVIVNFSVAENLTLSVLDRLQRSGRLVHALERELVADWITRLEVKTAGAGSPVTSLSGGNQQKVVIGRCLAKNPEVLILAEPTAGVDVGTRQAIYTLVGALADEGLAVIVTSTDTTDLIALCSRVIVLANGRIAGQLEGADINEHLLLTSMEAGVQ
jgi:ABC-type sugar transport system ATPase subunit